MIWFSFQKWCSSHGHVLTQERLYLRGKWTPLVAVRFRYLRTNLEAHQAAKAASPPGWPHPAHFNGDCKSGAMHCTDRFCPQQPWNW